MAASPERRTVPNEEDINDALREFPVGEIVTKPLGRVSMAAAPNADEHLLDEPVYTD